MNLEEIFSEHRRLSDLATEVLVETLERAVDLTVETFRRGDRVFACGNGGSAADSNHFAAELVGLPPEKGGPLAAMSLASNVAVLTAIANDFGYEHVFERQVQAWAHRGDVLIALSTSGDSPSVVRAAGEARRLGCRVVALTGLGGGALAQEADVLVAVPSDDVARVQEIHAICLHAVAVAVERGVAAGTLSGSGR